MIRIALVSIFAFFCTLFLSVNASAGAAPSFVYAINGSSADKYAVKTIFVDLFDASASRISSLKKKGRTVVCYLSAGSAEDWRSDYKDFPKSALGKNMSGWAGEKWIDTRDPRVRAIMSKRIAMARSKGCNGVDPDNVDGHMNKTGFPLTSRDQKDYVEFLAGEAHKSGLIAGLKNSAETAWDLQPLVDFVVIEECFKYNECDRYKSFVQNGKPVYQLEYQKKSSSLCSKAAKFGSSLVFADTALKNFTFCN